MDSVMWLYHLRNCVTSLWSIPTSPLARTKFSTKVQCRYLTYAIPWVRYEDAGDAWCAFCSMWPVWPVLGIPGALDVVKKHTRMNYENACWTQTNDGRTYVDPNLDNPNYETVSFVTSLTWRVQVVIATNSVNFSNGVIKPRVWRGRSFRLS